MLSSKELYDKIEQLRIKRGLSVAKLNSLAGISHGTLNSWTIRGTMPKIEVLDSLCFALGIPLAALLYDVDIDDLPPDEIELLSYWRKINEEQKNAIITTIKSMSKT